MSISKVSVFNASNMYETIGYVDNPPTDVDVTIDLPGQTGAKNLIVRTKYSGGGSIDTEAKRVLLGYENSNVTTQDGTNVIYSAPGTGNVSATVSSYYEYSDENVLSDLTLRLYEGDVLIASFPSYRKTSLSTQFFDISLVIKKDTILTAKVADIHGWESTGTTLSFIKRYLCQVCFIGV